MATLLTVDELLERVASQPPLLIEHVVSVPGPQLRELLAAKGGMSLDSFRKHPDQTRATRTFRYGHVVGAGLSVESIRRWEAERPDVALPHDLVQLLTRVDGIHLWANLDVGRSYFGIRPLHEWQDATHEWSAMLDVPADCVVVSYHDNGDGFLLLDARRSLYRSYDHEDIDHPVVVARSVPELLGWLWQEAESLRP